MGLRIALLLFAFVGVPATAADCPSLPRIEQFIDKTWTTLRRSNASLLKAAADQKVAQGSGPVVYVPRDLPLPKFRDEIRRQLTAAEFGKVTVLPLPKGEEPSRPGLL